MSNSLLKQNKVSVCDSGNNCVHAYGKNADLIAKGAVVMLLSIGVAALIRATSK